MALVQWSSCSLVLSVAGGALIVAATPSFLWGCDCKKKGCGRSNAFFGPPLFFIHPYVVRESVLDELNLLSRT